MDASEYSNLDHRHLVWKTGSDYPMLSATSPGHYRKPEQPTCDVLKLRAHREALTGGHRAVQAPLLPPVESLQSQAHEKFYVHQKLCVGVHNMARWTQSTAVQI